MPGLRRESWGQGDQKWLASAHGITNARTSALELSNFVEATHYPDGYLPSGLPLNCADEASLAPWTGAAGEKLGFLLFDQSVAAAGEDEFINVPVLRHGVINVEYLPVEMAAATEGETTGFVFIEGSDA